MIEGSITKDMEDDLAAEIRDGNGTINVSFEFQGIRIVAEDVPTSIDMALFTDRCWDVVAAAMNLKRKDKPDPAT